MNLKHLIYIAATIAVGMAAYAASPNNVIDEVAWMIGDEPIYKSEIEQAYADMQSERTPIQGDPYCVIPEQLAIERLFLHQADLDTVEIQESMVQMQTDAQMNFLITNLGSREKVEQYFRKPFPEIREYYASNMRNRARVQQVRSSLTKDLKVTPSQVRRYYDALPADSIPFVPLQVEVQVITFHPTIPRQEIEDVKSRLRDFTERINKGESEMSTLAILYSEDVGTAMRGGETGFLGRGELDPEYAAVAFNLNDTRKVSRIVESEYGYHIIQLVEKRGNRINTRHILLRPKVSDNDINEAMQRLDSLRTDIVDHKRFKFDEVVSYLSQDKDTRYNKGIMVNDKDGTTRFEMKDLPQDIAKQVSQLQPGEISKPFLMIDQKLNREVVSVVKLTARIEGHKANLSDDYQLLLSMYEQSLNEKTIREWLRQKIAQTYVRIEDGWRNCEFSHEGWIKEK